MHRAILGFALFATTPFAQADQILVLSGGGGPPSNHYSQYLQTKTLTDNLRTMLPGTEVGVLFGAGNVTGSPAVLADVHRVVRSGGKAREVMESGFIAQNQAATRANVDLYFKSSKVASMGKNETFFLLVSDHGMPFTFPDGTSDMTFSNNCIDLWSFESDLSTNRMKPGGPAQRCYSKDNLKQHLTKNIPAKRAVYAMSQCFSGGFHKMSVDMTKSYPTADSRICGFTAVTEDTTASGCTPDVDGPGYQGYERSFTEQLTGVDVVSGRRLRPARTSFAEAHEAATIEDLAKDIPLATSDFYLWKWALAIGGKTFVPRTPTLNANDARKMLASTQIGKMNLHDLQYRSKESFFEKMQNEFLRLYPEYSGALTGALEDHRKLEVKLATELELIERSFGPVGQELGKNMSGILAGWKKLIASGKSSLTPAEAKLELGLFDKIESNYGAGAIDQISLYILSMKTITDPALALAISEYRANRFPYAADWASKSGDRLFVDAAAKVKIHEQQMAEIEQRYTSVQKRHGHVRRLMIYREALGAWNALSRMGDTQALAELTGLLECESTKLP